MPVLTINSQSISVPQGTTLLQAIRELGFDVPTLCYLDGCEAFTSCMVCMVQDMRTGRLWPACSAPAQEGMVIETDNALVRENRRDALELLLSEHVGDCRAPCQRGCPAHMDIPLMIRQIAKGDMAASLRTVKDDIALPAVLGRICSAPCEKNCVRGRFDAPLAICLLKRHVADEDLRAGSFRPPQRPVSGKRVAIIGAGPAGLSAAYYLLQWGHACTLYDKNAHAGGALRTDVPVELLPREVLDAEIAVIDRLGARRLQNQAIVTGQDWQGLTRSYDALILALGTLGADTVLPPGVERSNRGVAVDSRTLQTSVPGIFVCGNAVGGAGRMAIRSVGQGKSMAFSVDQYLAGLPVSGEARRFDSRIGRMTDSEVLELLQDAPDSRPADRERAVPDVFSRSEAMAEAQRCLHCDCRKPESCKLRRYAEEYDAQAGRYKVQTRVAFEKIVQHDLVIYEPGKCIKCGLCVQITAAEGEQLGLTFIGRGFDVRIKVPFGESMAAGLERVAEQVIAACPTGAMARRTVNGERET